MSRPILLAGLLFVAACTDSTSDVVTAHGVRVRATLDNLTLLVEDIQGREALEEDTLEYSGEPLNFGSHDDAASRGLVVPVDAFREAIRSENYEQVPGGYGDRTWSWPLGALAGSRAIMDQDAENLRRTFVALARMRYALIVKTQVRVAPRFDEVKWGSIFFDAGRFAGEGWLVDLETGAVHGGFRFESKADPKLMAASEPDKIQEALERDFELELRRTARRTLAEKIPSTVID